MRQIIFILALLFLSSCKSEQASEKTVQNQYFDAENDSFIYSGRTLNSSEGEKLIASAASVKADVYGDTVTVFLKSDNLQHHYVAVELNNEYQGRFRITKDTLKFALPNRDSVNTLAIYKETEASNGAIIFNGLRAQNMEKPAEEKRAKIEFIGDSITCGMGADPSEINCEEGEWYDQHNVYMAYGPRVARILDVDFEVNCVSGMGIYRNWNDEDQPVMPEVYPYLHLNGNQGKRAKIKKEDAPDIVSIALGTNDFSLGDGQKTRLPFKSEKFKENYKTFIESLFEIYPETQMALLSSPMTGTEEGKELIQILKEIKEELADHPIEIFEFQKMNAGGCTGHPNVDDHEVLAEELVPFYRNLLNKK
ncbi:SGNH/GDSL hydrolase family protein [Salinimicrobium terrae]|uniref:SGNH/GDSL hydrolase family protein n=1 Tax=Salinimicrobium terrae TaxID=470866 RepID=UPI00041603C1|nr:SGNH/GDSL hydrolase family protein [Salinimicrobium terrae]